MAPSRGKGKASVYPLQKSAPAQGTRRTPRRKAQGNDGVASIYRDMLAEASANESEDVGSDRPLKRRKVAGATPGFKDAEQNPQTVEDSSGSSDNSDESEFDFEDVELEQPLQSLEAEGIQDVTIAVESSKAPQRTQASKRRAATPAEKAHRLLVHKLHILCLLGHCVYANSWCNDEDVHFQLRKLVPKKTQSYLTHNPEFSQFQQNRSFMDGLQQASEIWRGAFQITASGMRRPKWNASPNESRDSETEPVDRELFKRAAEELEGSQDLGNQLFCALLRGIGVDARLVCSLQVLPFKIGARDQAATPVKGGKKVVYASALGMDSPATDSATVDITMKNSSTVGRVPSARRRIGQPAFAPTPPAATTPPKKKAPIRKLAHPVFWIEAFNKAHQTWVPVDPLVTQTVNKPSKLEPPSSYEWNQMSYVVAFENDGVARDVTKRYTKAFNAKTRRSRVESAEQNGTIWLRRALRRFKRPRFDEEGKIRDQIEDAELAKREAQEGLPNNVQDFKHHPYYALERDLRRHEVIHPRREVGKVNAGTAAKPRMEAVFRRSDVQACKSAEKWFRVGREVKEGEQPLKRVPARRTPNMRAAREEGDDGEEVMISALYAPFQTQLYTPPPVVNGRVPRNAYGNLDIYVPSMVPAGGVHLRHPLAKEAARTLRIDAVDAVTGFKFQGRQGTAIIEGIIVPAESKEAVEAVIESLQDEQSEQDGMARSALALKMWKRFLVGLRIQERVSAYGLGTDQARGDVEMEVVEDGRDGGGGGFLAEDADPDDGRGVLPTAGKYSLAEIANLTPRKVGAKKVRKAESEESEDGGFEEGDDADQEDEAGGFEPEPTTRNRARASRRRVVEDENEDQDQGLVGVDTQDDRGEDYAGGFVPDEGMGGGGFVLDEDMEGEVVAEDTRTLTTDAKDEEDSGGGFMVDQEDADSVTLNEKGHNHGELAEDIASESQKDVLMRDRSPSPISQPQPPPICDQPNLINATDTTMPAGDTEGTVAANPPQPPQSPAAEAQQHLNWQVHGLAEAEQHTWPKEPDDEDHGDDSDDDSMLSHDPEDEDAEPDWLESD